MYQAAIEGVLGLRRHGRTLSLNPCIPSMWAGFSLTVRHGRAVYHISVSNADHRGAGVRLATIDGVQVPSDVIPFEDDGQTHEIVVELGVPLAASS
jgi:cyclic beta-1,2-glucan synthetase